MQAAGSLSVSMKDKTSLPKSNQLELSFGEDGSEAANDAQLLYVPKKILPIDHNFSVLRYIEIIENCQSNSFCFIVLALVRVN